MNESLEFATVGEAAHLLDVGTRGKRPPCTMYDDRADPLGLEISNRVGKLPVRLGTDGVEPVGAVEH